MLAPKFDESVGRLPWALEYVSNEIYRSFIGVYQAMTPIQPGEPDERRVIWFELDRGSIADYGDYKQFKREGSVDNKKEFLEMWESDYPSETKWYRLAVSEYDGNLYFFLDRQQLVVVPKNGESIKDSIAVVDQYVMIADCLLKSVKGEMAKLLTDEDKWNGYLEENLSYHRRYGRIQRKQFWEIYGENALRPDQNLGKAMVEKLAQFIGASNKDDQDDDIPEIKEMTANQFLRYCEIGYNANNYFSGDKLNYSPKEKYMAMADRRHDGLLDIDGDSPEAFSHWYHHEQGGGHPWEICRGGNSTHISLFAHEKNKGWQLTLAGSSFGRVEETVRIAIALYDNNIPFSLRDGEAILRMVKGEDYIGIVPKEVFPRYCHSHFPKEDQIIDFMNLPFENRNEVQKQAFWYPLERVSVGRK